MSRSHVSNVLLPYCLRGITTRSSQQTEPHGLLTGTSWLVSSNSAKGHFLPGKSQLICCPWFTLSLLGTKQGAGFSFLSLVLQPGCFCCLEWSGTSNHPQPILAIKQHFLERMCINRDCVLAATTHHKDEWLMGDLCLVSYEGRYLGDAETSVLLWNWQDRLACPSPCLMLLHELTLFFFVWVFGYVWYRLGPEAISQCDGWYDHKEAGGVGWGPLNISSIFSIPVPGYRQYHWEAEMPKAARKLQFWELPSIL